MYWINNSPNSKQYIALTMSNEECKLLHKTKTSLSFEYTWSMWKLARQSIIKYYKRAALAREREKSGIAKKTRMVWVIPYNK